MRKINNLMVSVLVGLVVISSLGACSKEGSLEAQSSSAGNSSRTTASAKTTSAPILGAAATTAQKSPSAVSSGSISATAVSSGTEVTVGSIEAEETAEEGNTSEDGDTVEQEVSQEEVYDLNGKVIKIAAPDKRFNREFFNSGYNFEFDVLGKRMDYVEDKYSCKIELDNSYVNRTKAQEAMITHAIAGTYYADITMLVADWLLKYRKFLLPLDEYIDFNDPMVKLNRCTDILVFNDRHYGVALQNKANWDNYLLYNDDILQREGLYSIFDLQMEHRWTWEALLDYSIKTTRDLDGDGITDQWGISTIYMDYAPIFIMSNGGSIISSADSNYRLALGDEKSIKALQFLSDLNNTYKVGILNKVTNNYILGKSLMAFVGIAGVTSKKETYPQNSVYVLLPMGPDVKEYVIGQRIGSGWAGAIPSYSYPVEDAGTLVKILYDLFSLYDPNYPDFIPGYDVNRYCTKPFSDKDKETFLFEKSIVDKNGSYFDSYGYLASEINSMIFTGAGSMFSKIMNENLPAITVIDSYKDFVNDKLNSYLNMYK